MLILIRTDVEKLLPMDRLIEAMSQALDSLASGHAQAPNRTGVTLNEPYRLLAAMPGYVPSYPSASVTASGSATLGTKLVTLFPENSERGVPSHQAVIVTFNADTDTPTALMDGTYITEMRTAACSAVATRTLSRKDARVHAVLGTGAQALTHALAITRVRTIEELRIAGRNPAHAELLATRLRDQHHLPAVAFDDFEAAVRGADVVSATTHSTVPVVKRLWLAPGAHVNSVGFNVQGREIDDQTIAEALVAVDSRAAATSAAPAGTNDILEPIADGLILAEDIAELGDLVAGRASGRINAEQLTLYKSVGVAVQDCAAAGLVADEALRHGLGTRIDMQ